jgi:hypothetical protein
MPEFQPMFEESRGQPIVYRGNTLAMSDFFPTEGATRFRLVIETCNGNPVRLDSASGWSPDRGREHRTPEGLFRTSVDGLAPWRNLEPPGRWRQGISICLMFQDRTGKWKRGAHEGEDGHIVVGGKTASGRNGIAFWQSKDWNAVEFGVLGTASIINIYNLWDCGNGVVHSWLNGAAMIVEEIPNGRRYRCNDAEADDDFDDIIFRLERLDK